MRWLLLVAVLVGVSGCHAVYAPNAVNTPTFREQGELRATVTDRNLQAAYAVTDHIGVMANGYYRSEQTTQDTGDPLESGTSDESGWLAEAGAGWFTSLQGKKWLQAEVYAGGGLGHVELAYDREMEPDKHFAADGTRVFVQPSVGVTSDYADAVLSLRVAGLWYSNVDHDYTPEELEENEVDGLEDSTWVFLEPCVTVRVGYKWVKLQAQIGKSYLLNGDDFSRDTGMTSFGLTVDLFRAWDEVAKK